MKKVLKILRNMVLTLVGLVILLLAALNFSSVQTYLARRAAKTLSEKLHTRVSVDHLRIDLLNHVVLEGVYIEDQQKDTLAHIGKAELRITDWFFLKRSVPVLHFIGLSNTYVHLYRSDKSDIWNYAFIADAFSSKTPEKKKTNTQQEFQLDLQKIQLDNVRFHMDDAWGGYDYDIDLMDFAAGVEELDFNKRKIDIGFIRLGNSSVRIRDFIGGKPPSKVKKVPVIDTTPFNPDNWSVAVHTIDFDNVHFRFVSKTGKPYPNEFDPEYIEVKNIDTKIRELYVRGDTLVASWDHFSASERSGLRIKELEADVIVSPVASICKNLYLETNNSKIGNYYAMLYDRFPDFEDYIARVKMVAHLKDAHVDAKDVAYFAPQLRALPFLNMVQLSGDGSGTVDKLTLTNLKASDGFSTIKGDLKITGLPDIDKTVFDYTDGQIFTTGASLLRYAPVLRDNPNLNLRALDYVYFKGDFKGLLNDFSTRASLTTNLGIVQSDIRMKMPAGAQPTYSGNISSRSFDAGRLLNQPTLGTTTFNAQLQGASFDPDRFEIKATTEFREFTFNNYTYRNIAADGVFDKQKFNGKLLLNDSNISLGFYGSIDLSQQVIHVNATANLLHSDLKALHFSETPASLTADFDLNCSGKNIDDFIGSAKLYNINLVRKKKRLDLDSINIVSYFQDQEKHIDIESNLLSAKVSGNFLLSEIGNSTQYFLSQYLPNYISKTKSVAASQDIHFDIRTREISDLLVAFSESMSGFDSSMLRGNLNTSNQTLTLEAAVPQGKIGMIQLNNATLSGKGNASQLDLNATVASFIVGKNLLNTSVKLDASVGDNKLRYVLATKSDEQIGTATLSGTAQASGDSLYFSFLPSELYLNNAKWEIAAGNHIVYAPHFLSINELSLYSGLQKIYMNSESASFDPSLNIHAENIDLGQIAAMTSVASYHPYGRLTGDVKLEHLFDKSNVKTDVVISDAKIGQDTFGTIKLGGIYESDKKLFTLNNTTGIFHPLFSLTAEGSLSFDPDNQDQINGNIAINNFPLRLLNPFLTGYVSKMAGLANGQVKINGVMDRPKMKGSLTLSNTLARIDYIGTLYSIPNGVIEIDDKSINLDNVELLDVYSNKAYASGSVKFNELANPVLNLRLRTDQFEVVNLKAYENDLFYGHVVAKTTFSVTGPLNDIRMSISATPTQKSSLYIPYNAAGDISTSSYISFKNYGNQTGTRTTARAKDRLSLRMSAVMNNLMDVTLVLDPKTGDQINATGNGNLTLDVPANDDYSMFGTYNIESGKYTFTFRQVLIKDFIINSGSSIVFAGNIANTRLNIDAIYPTRTRLYDLLDQNEINQISTNTKELEDAQAYQAVNVQLYMKGTLATPELNYEILLPEKRSLGTVAYAKLTRINQSDKSALTNQVSALLFLNSFIPSQGITSTMAVNGAKNTLGETLAGQASPVLTEALNKLIGDKNIQVLVQYRSYGQDLNAPTNSTASPILGNRDEIKVGLGKNYFNDRLKLQIGSAYDWGRPSSTNQNATASTFNLAGDFRAQYLLTPDGGISIVGFRSSNYDLYYGNISRQGVGISFKKSFNNLYEFFHSRRRIQAEREAKLKGGVKE
ncbi:translocation/assembly module TamB domain-containing protein [Rurimicrobium arvi]|uniref:translocation/assembly module TamB domain-containing protein n=1 Tax=Rurimicrobium arvi TaxID=2049916 RepID=UPI0031D2DECB